MEAVCPDKGVHTPVDDTVSQPTRSQQAFVSTIERIP